MSGRQPLQSSGRTRHDGPIDVAWDPFMTKSSEPDPLLSRPVPPPRTLPPARTSSFGSSLHASSGMREDDGSKNVAWDPFLTKNPHLDPEASKQDSAEESHLGPSKGFRCKPHRAIGIRAGPRVDAKRTGENVNPGEFFLVSEVRGDRGQRFLRLADGRGWVFTLSQVDRAVIAQESSPDWDSNLDPFMSRSGAGGVTAAAAARAPVAACPSGGARGPAASLLSRAGGPSAASTAGDSFYGATTQFPPPLKQANQAGLGAGLSGAEILGLGLLPWLIFTALEGLFAFLSQAIGECRVVLWGLVLGSLILGLLLFALGRIRRRPYQTALGILAMLAALAGPAAGVAVYSKLLQPGLRVDGGAVYRDVGPEEPSSTRADAAAIYFQEGAFVDAERSLGYRKDGVSYCVAPITTRERGAKASPEYWATGQDCCAARGAFWCGDTRRHNSGGAVVPTGPETPGANYLAAANMARVFFSLDPGQDGRASFVHVTAEAELYVDYMCPAEFATCACSLTFLIFGLLAGPQLARALGAGK